jgi:hypothetical protein
VWLTVPYCSTSSLGLPAKSSILSVFTCSTHMHGSNTLWKYETKQISDKHEK